MGSAVSSSSVLANRMERVFKVIDTISEWLGKVVSWFICVGALVVAYDVLMRYLFNAPTIWADGVSQRFFAAYYVLAGTYVLRYRGHIIMDLFYARWSPRTKAIVDTVTSVFFFFFLTVLLVDGAMLGIESVHTREVDNSTFRAPVYPIKLMIPVGAALMLLQGLAKFGRDLRSAVTGRAYES